MTPTVTVHPLQSTWGRFHLFSYAIDAPQLAVVDTGIASSPAGGMAEGLASIGRRVEDVTWILLTHGHIDHAGGAHALWELTGRRAQVVIHEADAPLLRSRSAHVDLYRERRDGYLRKPDGIAHEIAATEHAISGELEPTVLVRGGEKLDLGGGLRVRVEHVPGHTAGSVAYVIEGQNDVFVGDAVQIHGAANGFPGYMDPAAYRASLVHLRDHVRPNRMFQGHPYRSADGVPYPMEMSAEQAESALAESIAIEARIGAAARAALAAGLVETDSPYSPFEVVAAELGYTADPTLDPSPFFTTLDGYRRQAASIA